MLWPHFRQVGIRFMTLLHSYGAGHVARAEQSYAHESRLVHGAPSAPTRDVGAAHLDRVRYCKERASGDGMFPVRTVT